MLLTCGFCLRLKSRYRAVQLLGQGGFGGTFLAINEGTAEVAEAIGCSGEKELGHSLSSQTAFPTLCVIKPFLLLQTTAVKRETAIAQSEYSTGREKSGQSLLSIGAGLSSGITRGLAALLD